MKGNENKVGQSQDTTYFMLWGTKFATKSDTCFVKVPCTEK